MSDEDEQLQEITIFLSSDASLRQQTDLPAGKSLLWGVSLEATTMYLSEINQY